MIKDSSKFKKRLEEERAIVVNELKSVGLIKDERNPDDWQAKPGDMETERPDPNEVADRIESYEENTAIVTDLEGKLGEIDVSLANIETNTYGTCIVCKKDIEEDRLEANPSAQTCKEHMKS